MKRRKFIRKASVLPLVGSAAMVQNKNCSTDDTIEMDEREYYELRVYTMRWGGSQKVLTEYFQNALIPALNRLGVERVGAFSELGQNTPAKLYLLIPHPNMDSYLQLHSNLMADQGFQTAAKQLQSQSSKTVSYARYDTWLLEAFDVLKKMEKTKTSEDRLFELRVYEGHNDDAVRRKVKMFNNGELPIFLKTNLIPVFFGKMLAGKGMPALTYMLQFKGMEERDASWQAFIKHPEWKVLSKEEQYADSVSNIIRVFLKPLEFSQV